GSEEVQAGRSGGCGVHGRLRQDVSRVQGGAGAVLRESSFHLQLPRQTYGKGHLWRILRQHCCGGAFCSACSRQSQFGGSRASALCGHYHLFTDEALGRGEGEEGWRGRARRTGAHGREVCSRAWSAHGGVYHFTEQEGRCPAA